jgi:hypothetical protein
MTKHEFKLRLRTMRGYVLLRLGVGFIVLLAAVSGACLAERLEWRDNFIWLRHIIEVTAVMIACGCMLLLAWFANGLYKRFGLVCPNCSRPLVDVRGESATTGICRYCTQRVFSDHTA